MQKIYALLLVIFFVGCASGTDKKQSGAWKPPPPGTLVAADSMAITDDALNDFYFTVRVSVSPDNTQADRYGFRYDLNARFAHGEANAAVVMPLGGEQLRPIIRRDTGYVFIVGFIPGSAYGGDTSFHPYYRVEGSRHDIKVTAIKSYSFR